MSGVKYRKLANINWTSGRCRPNSAGKKETRFSMIQENYLLELKNRIVKWITYSS